MVENRGIRNELSERSITRWDGERNESVYERFDMSEMARGVDSENTEWVKRHTLRWFRHVEIMQGSA